MAFNPFLSMSEAPAPAATEVLNPFMMSDAEPADFGTGDNPFATGNPFSDFGDGFEPQVGDTVPADIFGGAEPADVCAKSFPSGEALFGDAERPTKPTELELVSTVVDRCPDEEPAEPQAATHALPPETQNLILTVTGQMEFTSSHLLDRIPPTRTPSPVSVRDIHSPSPTPEPDLFDDAPPAPDPARERPARPPPARPPRPAPPPRPQPPAPVDDVNLFDAPAPTLTKPTKEAILSLYSAPKKEEKQIDFLSDDIPQLSSEADVMMTSTSAAPGNPPAEEPGAAPAGLVAAPDTQSTVFAMQTDPAEEASAPMDCSEPPAEANDASPFADITDDSFPVQRVNDSDKNPFEMDDADYSPFGASDTGVHKSDDIQMASNIENSPFGISETEGRDTVESEDVKMGSSIEHSPFGVSDTEVRQTEDVRMASNVGESTFGANDAFGSVAQCHVSGSPMDVFGAYDERRASVLSGAQESAPAAAHTATAADVGWDAAADSLAHDAFPKSQDAFDAFSAKFDSAGANHMNTDAWGDAASAGAGPAGFEAEAFDPFLSMGAPPPPAATPLLQHQGSADSADDTFSVFIRPKDSEASSSEAVPALAPPPRPQALPDATRVNPFDKGAEPDAQRGRAERDETRPRAGSEDGGSGGRTPPTPLFDDDVSMPLEEFPRMNYSGPGWEMHLRQPNKKKITGQRFWKKIFVRLTTQGDSPVVQLLNSAADKEPLQELPLQACYSVSEVGAQQFDQFGKIFTVKLQYVFYKERPGVRPGQVTKAERITNKLSQFAAYAIQGDYQGVKEFGSDLRKLGLPVEHAPQVSQLFKIGSLSYEDVKQFSFCVEEALFRLAAHRDRALHYKMEEVQVTAVDELYVEQDAEGAVLKQIARVRLFFLGFLSGMPDVELGVNDLRRQGREVVGRHDIIPVATEEWIRVEAPEFHACVQPQAFDEEQIIKFKPPDACYIELMRFRVRPPKNRELPLQLKAAWCVTGNKVRSVCGGRARLREWSADHGCVAGGAARRRAGAGLRVALAGAGALRGRRHPLPHTRVLDLPVPRRETLPLRLRQVRAQTHRQDQGHRAVPGRRGHAAGVADRGDVGPGQVRAPAPRHRVAHAAPAQGGTRGVHHSQPGVSHGADVIRSDPGGARQVGLRGVHHAGHAGVAHRGALGVAAAARRRPAREVRALPRPPRVHRGHRAHERAGGAGVRHRGQRGARAARRARAAAARALLRLRLRLDLAAVHNQRMLKRKKKDVYFALCHTL